MPERDRRAWQAFVAEWAFASPGQKAAILGRKLLLVLGLLAVVLAAQWLTRG